MRWLWRSTILPCKAHKNYHIPASLPFSTNMQWIYMRLTLTWVQRYRWCTLHNKSETKAVGGVIQHDGGVCHGDGNADFCCATARAWQHFVAMRKETVNVWNELINSRSMRNNTDGELVGCRWSHVGTTEAQELLHTRVWQYSGGDITFTYDSRGSIKLALQPEEHFGIGIMAV